MTLSRLEWLGVEMLAKRAFMGKDGSGRLLVELARAPDRILTYDQLIEACGYSRSGSEDRTCWANIQTAVGRLRRTLEDVGLGHIIEVELKVGYRMTSAGRDDLFEFFNLIYRDIIPLSRPARAA